MLPSSLAISAPCVVLFGLERESIKGSFQKVKTNPKHLCGGGGGVQVFSGRAGREVGDRIEGGVAVRRCFKNGTWEW